MDYGNALYRPGVSNSRAMGWVRHVLTTPTPILAKGEKVTIHQDVTPV